MVQTTNYSFNKPTDQGSLDTWGTDFSGGDPEVDPSPGLNGNWTKADLIMKDFADRIAAAQATVDNIPGVLAIARIPIGGLYFSETDTDPATTLGYGTWAAASEDRIIVGVGNNGESDWTIGREDGVDDITLLEADIPSHTHTADPASANTSSAGSHNHSSVTGGKLSGVFSGGTGSSSGRTSSRSTNSAGSHTHTVDIPEFNTSSVGSGVAHENRQPTKGAYIWERIT